MSLTYDIDEGSKEFFSPENIFFMQEKIRQLFYTKYGRNALVHPDTIKEVMKEIFVKRFGQIYEMNNDVVNIIYSTYANEWQMEEQNRKLDKKKVETWDPCLGLRQHPPIKIKRRDYTKGFFQMNY